MEQLNFIHLRGNVGSVKTSQFGEGRSVCRFNLATNSITYTRDGAPVDEAQWFSCVLWDGKNTKIPEDLATGSPVEVKGRVKTNKFIGSDGENHYKDEVLVSEIIVLPKGERLTPVIY